MAPQRLATVIAFLLLFATGCSKENLRKEDCEKLRQGIVANNIDEVRNEINGFIANLPSDNNTLENLDKLAQAISSQCRITATVLCFGCIKTLPEQSEIRFHFQLPVLLSAAL